METFVARQPIFDRREDVYGYELLYRSAADRTEAVGVEKVLCGKRAFLNLDRWMSNGSLHEAFPSDGVVIGVPESAEIDESVVAACSDLHKLGIAIALDGFTAGSPAESLLPYAKIIKVDMRQTPRPAQQEFLRRHLSNSLVFLAGNVDTREEFEWTREAGYGLFQGNFFEKPEILSGKRIGSAKIKCLELLREISAPEIDCLKTIDVIRQDAGLSYKLLRYVNSSLFGARQNVDSIDQAAALLGAAGLRQWAALAAMPELALGKPAELAVKALVRAQFCERLAKFAEVEQHGSAFLIGLLSHLDAMLDLPLKDALNLVGLREDLAAIVVRQHAAPSALSAIFQVMHHYENADWEAVENAAFALHLAPAEVGLAYAESTFWTTQAVHFITSKPDKRSARRHTASGNLQMLYSDGDATARVVRGALQNVSETGMQLRSTEKVPVRSIVICNDSKLHISGRGIVRYCNFAKGAYLIGIEFSGGSGWREPQELKSETSTDSL